MRNVNPGATPPGDGASVLVVEGLGGGIGGVSGCDFDQDYVAYITISAINAGQRVITEFSPQSGNFACNANVTVQDWKNLLFSFVTNVVNSAPNSGTLWGGVMLDEESGFWLNSPGSVQVYAKINAFALQLMMTTPGMSLYYTETFSGQGDWSQGDFNYITYPSIPAPQIATDYMVGLANSYHAGFGANMLVTWSLSPFYQFGGLWGAEARVDGSPYNPPEWGMNHSNCFTNGASTQPCIYRDHKSDANSDGYSAADEITIKNCTVSSCSSLTTFGTAETGTCKDSGSQCGVPNPPANEGVPKRVAPPPATGYGCSKTLDTVGLKTTIYLAQSDIDLDGVVSILDLSTVAAWSGDPVDTNNPSDPRWEGNLDPDGFISILDLSAMADNFNRNVANNCRIE